MHTPRMHTPHVHTSHVHTSHVHTSRMHTPRMHTPRMHRPHMHKPRMYTPHVHTPRMHSHVCTHHACTHLSEQAQQVPTGCTPVAAQAPTSCRHEHRRSRHLPAARHLPKRRPQQGPLSPASCAHPQCCRHGPSCWPQKGSPAAHAGRLRHTGPGMQAVQSVTCSTVWQLPCMRGHMHSVRSSTMWQLQLMHAHTASRWRMKGKGFKQQTQSSYNSKGRVRGPRPDLCSTPCCS